VDWIVRRRIKRLDRLGAARPDQAAAAHRRHQPAGTVSLAIVCDDMISCLHRTYATPRLSAYPARVYIGPTRTEFCDRFAPHLLDRLRATKSAMR